MRIFSSYRQIFAPSWNELARAGFEARRALEWSKKYFDQRRVPFPDISLEKRLNKRPLSRRQSCTYATGAERSSMGPIGLREALHAPTAGAASIPASTAPFMTPMPTISAASPRANMSRTERRPTSANSSPSGNRSSMGRGKKRSPRRGKPGTNYLRNDLGLEPTLYMKVSKGPPFRIP